MGPAKAPNIGDSPQTYQKIDQDNARLLNSLSPFSYNLDLKNYRRKPYPNIVCMGDSISANSNSVFLNIGNSSWGQKAANYIYNNIVGKGTVISSVFSGETATWTTESAGINLIRHKSNNSSIDINFLQSGNQSPQEVECVLYYSDMPDGGEFDIKVDGVVVDTINCNGVEDNTKVSSSFIVPKDGNASVSPKTDNIAYVYGIGGVNTDIIDTPKFYNISTGGRKLDDYSDSEIQENVSVFSPDLYIMSLGANDYGSGAYTETEEFLRKVNIACDKAVSVGSDVLLMIMNRNEAADTAGVVQDRFVDMSNGLKNLATEKGYGLVSIDDAWGGWQKATDDGLVGDIVHPTDIGKQSIAQIMCNVLFQDNYDINLWTDQNRDTRFQVYNTKAEQLQNKVIGDGDILKSVEDNNGGISGYSDLLSAVVKASKAAFPKNPVLGSYAIDDGSKICYMCIKDNSDELGAEWLPVDGRIIDSYSWTPAEIPAGGSVLSSPIYGDNSLLENSFYGKRAHTTFSGDSSDFLVNTDVGGGSWYRIRIWNLGDSAKTPPSGTYKTVFYND